LETTEPCSIEELEETDWCSAEYRESANSSWGRDLEARDLEARDFEVRDLEARDFETRYSCSVEVLEATDSCSSEDFETTCSYSANDFETRDLCSEDTLKQKSHND
jgi:hypothetical protein